MKRWCQGWVIAVKHNINIMGLVVAKFTWQWIGNLYSIFIMSRIVSTVFGCGCVFLIALSAMVSTESILYTIRSPSGFGKWCVTWWWWLVTLTFQTFFLFFSIKFLELSRHLHNKFDNLIFTNFYLNSSLISIFLNHY